MVGPRERRKQAKTVATGCDQLPIGSHGKEGGSGSSPEEGSAKAPHNGAFRFGSILQIVERGAGMEPFMEPSGTASRSRQRRRDPQVSEEPGLVDQRH
jgi:hypothetical protein